MPPSIVLEVMKVLEKEIALREETRSLQQATPAMPASDYKANTGLLTKTQQRLRRRTDAVATAIRKLPDGERTFAKEITLLRRVAVVMHEAAAILASPNTGPEAIAAETEAIELLLVARRSQPNSAGGGGANPGGGGSGTAVQSALALLGDGTDKTANRVDRAPNQATGISGRKLPAEFRDGLDTFFGSLDASTTPAPDSEPNDK